MNVGKPREYKLISVELVNLFCFDSLRIQSSVLKILRGEAETKQQTSRYFLIMLFDYFQLYANQAKTATDVESNTKNVRTV